MEAMTILRLLANYEGWVKKNEIQFLRKDAKAKKLVLRDINALKKEFDKAEQKASDKGGSVSENLDWFETHKAGRELWHRLASCALNEIDKGSKGNQSLFDFLEAATRFEDLLYGLEEYYRDHTLHSLWVYFMGEQVLRELLPKIHKDLNWYLYNDIVRDSEAYVEEGEKKVVVEAEKREKSLCEKVAEKRDAIWCMVALCHDLGYSLAKLNDLNEKVEDVLRFFDVPDFRHVGYSLDIEHQYLVAQFLELMAMDVRIVPSENYRDADIDAPEKVLVK